MYNKQCNEHMSMYQHKEYGSSWQWQVLATKVHLYLEDDLPAEQEICNMCLMVDLTNVCNSLLNIANKTTIQQSSNTVTPSVLHDLTNVQSYFSISEWMQIKMGTVSVLQLTKSGTLFLQLSNLHQSCQILTRNLLISTERQTWKQNYNAPRAQPFVKVPDSKCQ